MTMQWKRRLRQPGRGAQRWGSQAAGLGPRGDGPASSDHLKAGPSFKDGGLSLCRCQRKPTHHPRVRGGQATCPGTQTSGQVPKGLLGPHARASKRSLSAASRPPEKMTLPKWGAGLQDSAQTALSPSPSVPQRRPLPSSPAQRPVPLRAASLLGPPRPSGVSCEPGPALWPNTLRAMSPRPAQRTARLVVLLSSSKDGGGGGGEVQELPRDSALGPRGEEPALPRPLRHRRRLGGQGQHHLLLRGSGPVGRAALGRDLGTHVALGSGPSLLRFVCVPFFSSSEKSRHVFLASTTRTH